LKKTKEQTSLLEREKNKIKINNNKKQGRSYEFKYMNLNMNKNKRQRRSKQMLTTNCTKRNKRQPGIISPEEVK